ncbi:hypothetical protein ACJMK2_004229 [Sinanodonta woodiana]|uniref:Uncharacterized protein n=1 Tax=Sinanodonta woodiana TaxID=1069815 RepID=A0ABD3Y0J1_SINWO
MRNHAVVLLLLSLFAVTLARDLHKRYANLEGDGALLDAFARALEEGKLDNNDLVQKVRLNMMKRWWGSPYPAVPA